MNILKKTLSSIFLVSILLVSNTAAYAAESTLKASVDTKDPLKPILTLTNNGTEPCRVVKYYRGAVSVSKMTQDGKDIAPQSITVAFDDGLGNTLLNHLQTLKPGESAQIPLRTVKYKDGYVLESVTWSQDAGAYGLIYQFDPKKPYTLEVTYAAPITVNNEPQLCPMTSTMSGSNSGSTLLPSVPKKILNMPSEVVAAMIVLAILIVLFLLMKKVRDGMKVIVIVAIFSSLLSLNKSVLADYDVPSSAQAQFDSCMATLNSHRDITGPVLDSAAGQHIIIEPNSDRDNDTAKYPDGSYHIRWDDTSTYNYYSDDGTPIPSTPCDRLYHELYHIHDIEHGTFSRDDCAGSGIETKEVMATRAQNALRSALGLPPRTHYGDRALPAGDCHAPPPPACDGSGCAESNGDPHLKTFDKLRYDFQAAGEFIAARDPAGDFEVQTRQEPWSDSRIVSLNTAVAMKINSDVVQFEMRNQKLTLLINGKVQPLEKTTLSGKGAITVDGVSQATVTWPDGSKVITRAVGIYGIAVFVDPSSARANKLEGLLGNFNGDPKDDLKINGTTTTLDVPPKFEDLYPKFADSWRVDNKSSLFTYQQGKNTDSYTDKSFPDKTVSAKDVPNRDVAEKLCRSLGVTDPDVLENCILDVALTGRPEFAKAAAIGQQLTSSIDYGGQTWTIKIDKPGDTATVEFDGKKDDKVFLDVSQTTFPDDCGALHLISPSGANVSDGCIIGGRGMIDGTTLPETGKYKITVKALNDKTGSAFLRLITIKDQIGTITADGPEVTATIDKPGVISKFSFDGRKGEKIFVEIPQSTLPDQCGGFGIADEAGQISSTGCIINGKGFIDTEELPATGKYSVFIDPNGINVGKATLKLIETADFKKDLTIGQEATFRLDKPGSVATLDFPGIAGQRVFIDITSSTIPDQCGGIYLHIGEGAAITNGCIINGKGTFDEKGVILPQTGTYTITIDPAENKTGVATVKVRM